MNILKEHIKIKKYNLYKMKSIITLFHGSPHNIEGKIKPSVPRGSDKFQTQKAVFATDIEKSAQIYAITRDKKRKRKGWFVYKDQLHILKPYSLNKKGYVYVFSTRNYIDDPKNNPNQYAVLRQVQPKYKYVVKYEDIRKNIIEYKSKDDFNKSAKKLLNED